MLVLQTSEKNKLLQFFQLADQDLSELKSSLQKKIFDLKFQHPVKDFFILKDKVFENLDFKSFLVIITTQNFIIYRESKMKIIKKIFALPNPCLDLSRIKFSLMYKVQGSYDKTVHDIKGIFVCLTDREIKVAVIANMFEKKQTLIEDQFRVDLESFDHHQIVSAIIHNLDQIKLVVYSKDFALIKYCINHQNPRDTKTIQFFQLIDKTIETDKYSYDHNSKHLSGTLKESNKNFQKMDAFYERKFQFRTLKLSEEINQNNFCIVLSNDLLIEIDIAQPTFKVYQIQHNRENTVLKNSCEASFLSKGVLSINYLQSNKDDIFVMIEDPDYFQFAKISLDENKAFRDYTELVRIQKTLKENSKMKHFEFILHNCMDEKFTVIYLTDQMDLFSSNHHRNERNSYEMESIDQIKIDFEILEMYKTPTFPFSLILLSSSNLLHFYSKSLKYLCKFDLTPLNRLKNKNPFNFQIEHLYDSFYILQSYEKISIGQLSFHKQSNAHEFHIIKYEDFYLNDLWYHSNEDTQCQDLIVFVNQKNICLRNNNKLVFGSLKFKPLKQEDFIDKHFLSIHGKLLQDFYDYQFFSQDLIDYCLQIGEEFFLYYFVWTKVQNQSAIKFSFDWEFLEENIGMSKAQFLDKTELRNESQFFQELQELKDSSLIVQNQRETFSKFCDQIGKLSNSSQSLDAPSKSFLIQYKQEDNNKRQFTSEQVFLCICSDQQEFIFQNLFPGKNILNPPSLQEMEQNSLFYWYENLDQLKKMIDKSVMIKYKNEKNIFDIIFWFVLLGKTKLLVPLFKLEPNQQKFVTFFSNNFNDPTVISKTLDNAFVLRSQKKLELCAAFFILAKRYQEAIDILTEDMKKPQLGVLLFRVFEREIQNDESQLEDIRKNMFAHFQTTYDTFNDLFILPIFFHLWQEQEKIFEFFFKKLQKKVMEFVNQEKTQEYDYGFKFTTFSLNFHKIFAHCSNSPNWKQFWNKALEKFPDFDPFELLIERDFQFFKFSDKIQLTFITLILLKKQKPKHFQELTKKHSDCLSQMIVKIGLKKVQTLIKKNHHFRINSLLQLIQVHSKKLQLNEEAISAEFLNRVSLLNDCELNLYIELRDQNYSQSNDYFQLLLQKLLSLSDKMLSIDLFQYFSSFWWVKKINYIQNLIRLLHGLSTRQEDHHLELHKKYINHFTDGIVFFLFLICISTNSWDEAILLLDSKERTDIASESFEKLISNLKEKLSKKFVFFTSKAIKQTEELEFYQSNINTIIVLFMKNILFHSFQHKVIGQNSQIHFSSTVTTRLIQSIQIFSKNIFKSLFKQLNCFNYDEKYQLVQEIKSLFSNSLAMIKRTSYYLISPAEALDLKYNQTVFSSMADTSFWLKILDDHVLQSLLENELLKSQEIHLKQRKEFFRQGVELFKGKVESSSFKVGSNKVISQIFVFKQSFNPEIFILIDKQIRKVYLFDSLFKKQRIADGYQLKSLDDLKSFSVVNETPSILSETYLQTQPFVLRIMFNLLFKNRHIQKNQHQKEILEKIIDQKNQTPNDFNNIKAMANHSHLPIFFIAQGEVLFIVSKKTLGTLGFFSDRCLGKIKEIVPDEQGYKLIVIDYQKNAFILRYDIGFQNIELILEIEGKSIVHCCWVENSTKVFFTSSQNKIFILDFIDFSLKEEKISFDCSGSSIYNCSEKMTFLLVQKKNSKIYKCSSDFQIEENYVSKNGSSLSAYSLCIDKKLVILGYKNGEMEVFDYNNMTLVDSQIFEDKERKKIQIDSLNLVDNFIVCGFTNGVLSIVGKV